MSRLLKTRLLLLLIALLAGSTVHADVMIIGLRQTDDGKTQHTMDAHVVTFDYLVKQMEKLSHMTSGYTPLISIQKDVPSSEAFNLLAELRRLGFHKFEMLAEGSVANTTGTHIFTFNTESNAVGFCLGIVETNNFTPVQEIDIDTVTAGDVAPTNDLSKYRVRGVVKQLSQTILLSKDDPPPKRQILRSHGVRITYVRESDSIDVMKMNSFFRPVMVPVDVISVDKEQRTYVLQGEDGKVTIDAGAEGIKTNLLVEVFSVDNPRLLYGITSADPTLGNGWSMKEANKDSSVTFTNQQGRSFTVPFHDKSIESNEAK